jgi:hypothetical protein
VVSSMISGSRCPQLTQFRNRAVEMCRGWLDADEANGEFS